MSRIRIVRELNSGGYGRVPRRNGQDPWDREPRPMGTRLVRIPPLLSPMDSI